MTACVLLLAFVVVTIGNFVVGGGIEGMAANLESSGVAFDDFLFENVLWIFAATLGVGLFLRRTPQQTLDRLGLRLPTAQDITWGVGMGVLLFGAVIAVGVVWSMAVSPEQLQQQTAASEQLARSIDTLPLSLAISVVVAIGEEVFFRGALQPVFGIWLTSLFFAILHTQYTLTPATLLIFVTALAFGWLRQRYSTSSAIVAHFVYNFIQLALAVLAGMSL
jgi:membrane protease YdiL (CAAX protease family)